MLLTIKKDISMEKLSLSDYSIDDLALLRSQIAKEMKSRFIPKKKYAHPTDPFKKWCGRGRMPKWLRDELERGKSIETFLSK